ncbi:MAG: hypothetical protein U0992_01085 [Planctomycetaceae bacterium]
MSAQRSIAAPAEAPPRGSPTAPLFWICLLVAAGLYAPCVLAGRFVAWRELQYRHLRNQAELVGIQQDLRHLQRVADALEQDPEFAGRVARAELGAAPSRTRVIALPPELNGDPREPPARADIAPPKDDWYMPTLRRIAGDAALRRNLLCAAAGIFLLGFLLFRETTPKTAPAAPLAARGGAWRTIFGRYLRDADER